MTSPLIIVAAAPRTGSNHVMNVLSGFENHRAHTEVFARDIAYTMGPAQIQRLIDITGCIVPLDQKSPTTTQLIYDEPFATLQALADTREDHHTSLSLKLFGYHLPRYVTKAIFEEIKPTVLVVYRRCIDSYISKLKAQQLQAWCWRDTTYIKPEADVRDFEYWYGRHADWYEHVEGLASDTVDLHYVACGDQLPRHLSANLRAHDLGAWSSHRCMHPPFTRQDRNEHPGDKLANWDEFAAALEERGLYDKAMGYF